MATPEGPELPLGVARVLRVDLAPDPTDPTPVDMTTVTGVSFVVYRQADTSTSTWVGEVQSGATTTLATVLYDVQPSDVLVPGLYEIGVLLTLSSGQTVTGNALRVRVVPPWSLGRS